MVLESLGLPQHRGDGLVLSLSQPRVPAFDYSLNAKCSGFPQPVFAKSQDTCVKTWEFLKSKGSSS